MLTIRAFELPPVATNAYLVSDAARGEAFVVDAPAYAWEQIGPVLEKEGLKLVAILITHTHFDHVLGAADLKRNSGAPLYCPAGEQAQLANLPQQMARFGFGEQGEVPEVDRWLKAGDSLELLGRTWGVREAPGHSVGHLIFPCPAENLAFVGDVIFAGSVGRTDLPGGSFERLKQSIIEQVYSLPNDTDLFPGHGGQTTVGRERTHNPYVQGN